jgi:hypothetical protein
MIDHPAAHDHAGKAGADRNQASRSHDKLQA